MAGEGVLCGEIARSDLTLPQAIVKLELSRPDPERTVAAHVRGLTDAILAGPLVLFRINPHRLIVLLPRANASLVDHFAYQQTVLARVHFGVLGLLGETLKTNTV